MAARRMQMCRPIFAKYRYLGMQMSSIISGVSRQKFTIFLLGVATSSPLLTHTFRQWYCNSFSSNSAKNASGINRRSWHFTKISWLPRLDISENEVVVYHLHPKCFHMAKRCKNQSSMSWDIRLNMQDLPCRTKSLQMSLVFSEVTGPQFTTFLRDIAA